MHFSVIFNAVCSADTTFTFIIWSNTRSYIFIVLFAASNFGLIKEFFKAVEIFFPFHRIT